ncbi:MAG: glycosyltransferase family 39 protein [Planctomycetota bacterium]
MNLQSTPQHITLVLCVAFASLFTNLGATQLIDRDEPRNAGCAQEMRARGDYVVPIFNDQLRDAKPILTYWLILSAYEVFGVTEFASRFWSALLATGTVLATYAIGHRLLSPTIGLWGAIILATSTMFCVAGRVATPDSPLIFCVTAAMLVFVYGVFPNPSSNDSAKAQISSESESWKQPWFPRNFSTVLLLYAVMGVGILAKGPVGIILPMAILGMFMLVMRLPTPDHPLRSETNTDPQTRLQSLQNWCWQSFLRVGRTFGPLHFLRTLWAMRPITAICVSLLIAAPWFILVGLRTDGDFLRGFFLTEHFGRATQTFENHRGSIFFYPLVLLLCFFPWSIFAGPTVFETLHRLRVQSEQQAAYVFLACWVCVWVGAFSIAQTKLPSYVTPCYPALALLTAGFVHHWLANSTTVRDIWPKLSLLCLGLAGIGLMVGLPVAAYLFLPGEQWLGAVGLIPLVGAIVAYYLYRNEAPQKVAITLGCTTTAFIVAVFAGVMVQADSHQNNRDLLAAMNARSSNPNLASFRVLESSWVFYANRPVVELFAVNEEDPNHDSAQASELRSENWHPHPKLSVQTFFEQRDEPYLITTREHWESTLEKAISDQVEIVAETGYFLKQDESLVLLGKRQVSQQANAAQQDPNIMR